MRAIETFVNEEIGLSEATMGSPVGAALGSLTAFAAGAVIPLRLYLLAFGGVGPLWASIACATAALFAVGVSLSRLTHRSGLLTGLRQAGLGLLAGGVTYGVGALVGTAVHGGRPSSPNMGDTDSGSGTLARRLRPFTRPLDRDPDETYGVRALNSCRARQDSPPAAPFAAGVVEPSDPPDLVPQRLPGTRARINRVVCSRRA